MATFVTEAGKKVYGGGGIYPDIQVNSDTIGYNRFYRELLDKKILFDFVYDVLGSRYRQEYLSQHIDSFNISTVDYAALIKYMERKKVTIDQQQLMKAKPVICNDLKVLLYKYHLGDAGYFKALNQHDEMVKQAVNSLQ